MTNLPQTAPSAYPQYAAGAPVSPQFSVPSQAAPAPGDQGQAWHLLSQAATAMAAATQAPAPMQAPAATAAAAVQVPAAAPAAPAAGGGLRMNGPWVAGQIYGVVPAAPLTPVPDNAEKWYAITKGRYVGVTNSAAIADGAVSRVSHSLRTGYSSQSEAIEAFNDALAMPHLGLVAVVN
ncbi:hypothetical protein B0H11DRAFT_2249989 [Mycena galericulata]|nr:hypothetical protein B0H11DRAFT_2264522 [Mycena galericulata]KAJ7444533.1 hypothetical protein B0H11DRAFT_2249989 [Mycena galericulata]